MATETIPADKLCSSVEQGFKRIEQYRKIRAMFIRAYVGQYYPQYSEKWPGLFNSEAIRGGEPINLFFNTIRVLVPNTIMKNPIFDLNTSVKSQKEYAELLGLGVTQDVLDMNLKQTLREWLVDSYFGFGIIKTAIQNSGQVVTIDDNQIDPGQTYSSRVDLDNFTFDPDCNEYLFKDASFVGDMVTVPRQQLLDSDMFASDLVKRIPSVQNKYDKTTRTDEISGQDKFGGEYAGVRDKVQVIQLWMPFAKTKIFIPDPRIIRFDKFLAQTDYYGPDEGPYDYLSLSQPVPGNPLPVAPAGIWYDLHQATNRIFSKMLDQAERQKDVLIYHPAHSDEAYDIMESTDGDTIASIDPSKFNLVSFGGANAKNESMTGQLQSWYNLMAGNPDQLAGASSAGTATEAQINESNSTITLQDARDILHDKTASIGKKIAWYKDTNPLLEQPLEVQRDDGEAVHITLTPEQRAGDFLNFTFKVRPKSMVQLPPREKARRIAEFATNILPAGAQTAQVMIQMGFPFNLRKYFMAVAKEMDLEDWLSEVFDDPEFAERMELVFTMRDRASEPGQVLTPSAIAQNNGSPTRSKQVTLGDGQRFNAGVQQGATEAKQMQGVQGATNVGF